MISVVYGIIIAAFIALGICSLSAASAQTGPSINATNIFDSGQNDFTWECQTPCNSDSK
jgi:hypothetical protein